MPWRRASAPARRRCCAQRRRCTTSVRSPSARSSSPRAGELNAEERAAVNRHPEIGAQILADTGSELLELARNIAYGHHERWDGTGYPQRLAAEEIPLPARITAIADVFDALTSPRPYRPAWRAAEAMSFISAQSGRLFDPGLTAIFLCEAPAIAELTEHRRRDAAQFGPGATAWSGHGESAASPWRSKP